LLKKIGKDPKIVGFKVYIFLIKFRGLPLEKPMLIPKAIERRVIIFSKM